MTDSLQTPDEQDVARPAFTVPTLLTTPTHVRRHSVPERGVNTIPQSDIQVGRFGRMFRNLPLFAHDEADLIPLANKMVAPPEDPGNVPADTDNPSANPDLPAGYTYLGQFLDHDITFDPVSSLVRQNDPDALFNFRTPRLDLDSLYGRGPADDPFLYRHDDQPVPHPSLPGADLRGIWFRLGEFVADPSAPEGGPDLPRDQPRTDADGNDIFAGRALIGDPRNDENLIVSQLHGVFLKFHNKVVEQVASTTPLRDENLFKEAQRLVRWHYQWVIVHDFLARIVGQDVVDDVLPTETFRVGGTNGGHDVAIRRPRLLFYRPVPGQPPFLPVEFSVACYRFGHSMIRPSYLFNNIVPRTPTFVAQPGSEFESLNGFRRLPGSWGFDWKFFFEVEAGFTPQRAFKIDAQLANPLNDLPATIAANPSSLPQRNLRRGLLLGVPGGQVVSRAMGIPPLGAVALDITDVADDLQFDTPLWYYILKEAELQCDGKKLGPVGGRIVAEVIVGLVAHDPLSYFNVDPAFTPEQPFTDTPGEFTMAHLIRFATS